MKRVALALFLWMIGSISLVLLSVHAQEPEAQPEAQLEAQFEELVVTGRRLVTPTKQTDETVYTGKEVTRKGIEAQGSRAEMSVYEAINILPGVNVENPDPFGLAAEQKSVRFRGVRSSLGAMTVEGVPNWGGNPIGPRDYLYDTENFQGIAVYKGATPADLGTGVGARGGAVELRPLWPREKFGAMLSQGFGSFDYSRSFLRLDSGELPFLGTQLSLSSSYTEADKWKGPGDLGPRKNLNFMLSQPVPDQDDIKFWLNFNDQKQDLYKSLSYAQFRQLDANYSKDFNNRLTGVRARDIDYYLYNQADLSNYDLFAVLPLKISDCFRFSLKPYYANEDSSILNGTTSQGGLVTERLRDIERYGVIADATADFDWIKASVGYWLESVDMSITTRNFLPGSLAFRGYGIFSENEDEGRLHSPYLRLAGSFHGFDWQAGVKYFYYRDPATRGYTSAPRTFELVRAPDLDRAEKTYEEFLPTFGLAYNWSENFQTYASYGRNQIRPYSYVPIINIYSQNRARFLAAGITLADLFDGYDMEITDAFELGARYRRDWFEVMPTFFFSKNKNLLITIYDPRVNLNYQQNVGDATGIGFEMETNFYVNDYLTAFINPTYVSLTLDDDLTFSGNRLDTEGKQVTDTPEWFVKAGLSFRYRNFEVVPMVRYVGERYGDAENTQRVGDHFLADLRLSYTYNKLPMANAVKVSLDLYNVFDRKYVAGINASDDTRQGQASYFVGPPFTAVVKLSMDF
jgi:iron complex outermembrane receptor protein